MSKVRLGRFVPTTLREWNKAFEPINSEPEILSGVGSPEGVVSAPIGTLYMNLSGGANTTLYVKTSGTGKTGWTAK